MPKIDVQCQPLRNPVAVLDLHNNVIGAEEKAVVHARDMLHASTILLLIHRGKLILGRRHPGQSFPGCLDTLGGHQHPDESPYQCCVREASEEILLFAGTFRVAFERSWVQPIGANYSFENDVPGNRERSTLYGISIPDELDYVLMDQTNAGIDVRLESEPWTMETVLDAFEQDPSQFADGIGRVLSRAIHERQFLKMLIDIINPK